MRTRRGFTLTEILVAVMVLSLCILGILPLVAVAARAHRTSLENETAAEIAKAVFADLEQSFYEPWMGGARKQQQKKHGGAAAYRLKGFPDEYRGTVTTGDLAGTEDVTRSGVLCRVRIRWLPRGAPDVEGEGRVWEYSAVLAKRLDHRDAFAAEARASRLERSSSSASRSRPASYDPIIQWVGPRGALGPEVRVPRPSEKETVGAILETLGGSRHAGSGPWTVYPLNRGTKGVATLSTQAVRQTSDGRTVYALAAHMSYHPFARTNLARPRIVMIGKRDVYLNDVKNDMNGQPFQVAGGSPYLEDQQNIGRGSDPDARDLSEQGVSGTYTAGIADPWSMSQNYRLRANWTLYGWVVAEGPAPIGYFSLRVTVQGTVGAGPLDSKLEPNLEVATFIEADGDSGRGADDVLRKAIK